jgi:fumarate reductase subunit D
MVRHKTSQSPEIIEGKIFAVLAYLSILCIIPLLFKKENAFVLAHSKQGLVIFLGEVGIFILHIALGPWILRLGMFVLLGLSFVGIIAVLRGDYLKFPLITTIAEQITL